MNTDFKSNFLQRLKNQKSHDLFGEFFIENMHWGKLYFHLFGRYYSRYRIRFNVDSKGLVDRLISFYSLNQNQILRNEMTNNIEFTKVNTEFSETLLILKEGFMIIITDHKTELMYDSGITELEKNRVIKLIEEFKIIALCPSKFYMVQRLQGELNLADFDIKQFDIDLETHYNDDFQTVNSLIFNSLSTLERNGLILLHGKYGSGKTYYLRYLMSKIERKFIYFPLSMLEELNSPEFLPFICEERNSVLILEDCESLLVHRENGHNNASALSNLLNLGDGLLSDALSINVICTFNAGIKKIDDAILRKGRLLARYEFKELELRKARALAQKIGRNANIEHPMTVSDIYNLEEKSFENKPVKSIGFKAA